MQGSSGVEKLKMTMDLDKIVKSVEETQLLRRDIYDNPDYTSRQRRNFPNGIKKYFEFVNGYELPRRIK